jgi:hypothetical protein
MYATGTVSLHVRVMTEPKNSRLRICQEASVKYRTGIIVAKKFFQSILLAKLLDSDASGEESELVRIFDTVLVSVVGL